MILGVVIKNHEDIFPTFKDHLERSRLKRKTLKILKGEEILIELMIATTVKKTDQEIIGILEQNTTIVVQGGMKIQEIRIENIAGTHMTLHPRRDDRDRSFHHYRLKSV